MVESYGTFDDGEVSSMNQRQREDHAPLAGQEPANLPLQRPSGSPDGAGAIADRPDSETPSGGTEAPTARYIVCPHCGERIPLPEIGGV